MNQTSPAPSAPGSVFEVFFVMLRLGCLAFGGPVAHLAHFQSELIEKRKWLAASDYADLIAFCQFLPGPASSQVGMGLGLLRAGIPGMFAAWCAFSLPSVVLLLLAAGGMHLLSDAPMGWLHGLLAGIVAIVADAIWKMGKKLCPTSKHTTLALLAGAFMLLVSHPAAQIVVIILGAVGGLFFLPPPQPQAAAPSTNRELGSLPMVLGWTILLLLVVAPVGASLVSEQSSATLLNVYASFAQTGALVFGGGHVVLPMLQAELVTPQWLSDPQFLAGYGITQAMPGPIFTLSSYLGASIGANLTSGVSSFLSYGLCALLGIFMPSFGFIAALFPLWHRMRASTKARRALAGINASVIGLLIAALYDPVLTKALANDAPRTGLAIVLVSWVLLVVWKRPAWLVVGLSAMAGALLQI